MARIVIGAACSHGPSIQGPPEDWARLGEKDRRDPRFDYAGLLARARPGLEAEITLEVQRARHAASRAAMATLAAHIRAARPDVLLVISNAHVVRHQESRPVFSILRAAAFPALESTGATFETVHGGDDQAGSMMPGHPDLANHLIAHLIDQHFDVGCFDTLPEGAFIDEAFAFCYKWLLDGQAIPMVPLYLSRDLPNQATPGRCVDFGKALGAAIASFPQDLRVCVIASGGLSHQVVDEELDRGVLARLADGDLEALRNVSRARLNGAPGTPEILNWITLGGVMAPERMTLLSYEPCYRSLASTGHGAGIAEWAGAA